MTFTKGQLAESGKRVAQMLQARGQSSRPRTRRSHGRTKPTGLRAHLYPGHGVVVRHEPLTARRRTRAPPGSGGGDGARHGGRARRTGLPAAAAAAAMPRRRFPVPGARDGHLRFADARRYRRVAWGFAERRSMGRLGLPHAVGGCN